MRILVWFIACWLITIGYAQNALVGNEGGQWMLYSDEGTIMLPKTVHSVGNFDSEGLTYFAEFEKYGILNTKGEIIQQPEFLEIEQLGSGIYRCLSTLGQVITDYTNTGESSLECTGLKRLLPYWYLIQLDNSEQLLNAKTKERYELEIGDTILNSGFNHVYVQLCGERILLNPHGEAIPVRGNPPLFYSHYLLIDMPDLKSVVFRDHTVELPAGAKNIKVFDKEIFYADEKNAHILEAETGRIVFSAPYDNIQRFGKDRFLVQKGFEYGIMEQNGNLLCAPKYNYIYDSGSHYSVGNQGGNGLMDKKGKEVVPCAYQRVSISNDFFQLFSSLGYQGLISRRTNAKLLDCIYDKVSVNNDVIRAWSGDKLRIMKFSPEHKIESNLLLSDVITLRTNTPAPKDVRIDQRLFSVGWVMEMVEKKNPKGKVKMVDKWGLKDAGDSLILPVRYQQPKFIPYADFSLVPQGETEYSYAGAEKSALKIYRVVSHVNGRTLIPERIFGVDTMDLLTRSYTRFIGIKGPGILRSDNTVERVDFIDGRDADFVRFCKAKQRTIVPAKKSDPDAVAIPNVDLNDSPAYTTYFWQLKKRYSFVRFEGGSWNYFDSTGNELFEKPFSFAKPFYRNTAIVQREGKWGVINKDSVVIPCRFNSVKRLSVFGDTVFQVQRVPKGIRILDTLSHLVDKRITKIVKSENGLTLVQFGRKKKVINENYEIVSGDASMQKLMGGNLFMIKRKKEYVILNNVGEELGTSELRPTDILNESYLVVKDHGKVGLLDFYGDTLIPFEYKEIRASGNYILAIDKVNNKVFDGEFSEVKACKAGEILVDAKTQNFAVNYPGKCVVFDTEGKVLERYSGFYADYFFNGKLIQKGKQAIVKVVGGEDIELAILVKEVEVVDDYFLIQDYKNNFYFFSADFVGINEGEKLRRARYVGNGFVTARSGGNVLIFSANQRKLLSGGARIQGSFNSGYLLVRCENQSYYLNTDLENEFKRDYEGAQPFKNGYAAVEEQNGWTIIDQKGLPKSLGSYSEIQPLGNNLFSTKKQALYGLYDSHGNQILPAEFQEINVLTTELIQGVREGTIFYFDRLGKPLNF